MNEELLEMLVCPVSLEKLMWNSEKTRLVAKKSGNEYDVVDGIPILVPPNLRESLNS